jgi:hypothetical protein
MWAYWWNTNDLTLSGLKDAASSDNRNVTNLVVINTLNVD